MPCQAPLRDAACASEAVRDTASVNFRHADAIAGLGRQFCAKATEPLSHCHQRCKVRLSLRSRRAMSISVDAVRELKGFGGHIDASAQITAREQHR